MNSAPFIDDSSDITVVHSHKILTGQDQAEAVEELMATKENFSLADDSGLLAIFLIHSGAGSFEYNTQRKSADGCTEFAENDIVIAGNPSELSLKAEKPVSLSLLLFDINIFSNLYYRHMGQLMSFLEEMADGFHIIPESDEQSAKLKAAMEKIWENPGQESLYDTAQSMAALWEIAGGLYQNCKAQRLFDTQQAGREKFREVVRYIEENYDQKIMLEKLAKSTIMSVPSFSTRFRAVYGMPPMEYVISIRLRHASQQLIKTKKKILDIAEDCGFPSISNFIRLFQKTYGLTPSQYRLKNSDENI